MEELLANKDYEGLASLCELEELQVRGIVVVELKKQLCLFLSVV